MNYLSVEEISKSFGERSIFEKLTFGIEQGQKVAIVAKNGAGKTTLLSAMLEMTEVTERILILEDTHELRIDHPHVVQMQSKLANSDGAGEWNMQDLIRQALRMRPTRIVMGEVRGREIIDFLLALNTGHDGGCGTIHANSALEALEKLKLLPLLAGENIPASFVSQTVERTIGLVVHCRMDNQGKREVSQVIKSDGQGNWVEVRL